MRYLKTKKQRVTVVLSVIFLLVLVLYAVIVSAKPKAEEVRYREYPVAKGDIIAGVEGSGSIYYEKVEHLLEHSAVIGEIYVKEGEAVNKGDKLLTFSTQWLEEKEKELKDALTKAKNDLADAQKTLEIAKEKHNQTVQNLKNESRQTYETSRKELEVKLDAVKDTISSKEEELAIIKEQLASGENAEIQQRQQQVHQELEAAHKELGSIQASIEQVDATYEQTKQKNNSNISMDEKNQQLESQKQKHGITQLENEVNKAQELYDALQKCKEKPYIEAAVDGVVLKVVEGVTKEGDPGAEEGGNGAEEGGSGSAGGDGGKPHNGVVQEKGTSVVTIGDRLKKMVKVYVVQEDISKIQEGQKVEVQTNAFEDITFIGQVQKCILKSVEQGGVIYYPVEVALDETTEPLLDGMTAYATFIQKEKKGVLTLSNKAIFMEDKKQFVMVKEKDETIHKKEITTGFSDGNVSEVLSGLKDKDIVVVEG